MNSSDVPPARIRLAIGLSIAAHLCALWLLAALLADRFIPPWNEPDTDTVPFITTIEHRARTTAQSPRRTRETRRPASAQVAFVERPAAAVPRTAPPRLPGAAAAGRPYRLARTKTPPRPTPAFVAAMPSATLTPAAAPALAAATPSPPPSPPPSATPSPAAVVAASFGGLFSQNYPPALTAPGDLAEIRALVGGHARIRVDVDETGQATDVHFVAPISDPQIEQEVRGKLLALHYVPADCNGLHCEGTIEMRF
jgi:hypothetical protein